MTIVNARRLAERITQENGKRCEDIEKEIQEHLKRYLRAHTIRFVKFVDDLRLAKKEDRESVAACCEMEGMEGFFNQLRAAYDVDIPPQPTHVSLYTLTGKAVGINSPKEMSSFVKIDLPEVQKRLNTLQP